MAMLRHNLWRQKRLSPNRHDECHDERNYERHHGHPNTCIFVYSRRAYQDIPYLFRFIMPTAGENYYRHLLNVPPSYIS